MKSAVLSRRQFGKGVATALAASALPVRALWGAVDSTVRGVKLGAITGSFANGFGGPGPGRPSGPAGTAGAAGQGGRGGAGAGPAAPGSFPGPGGPGGPTLSLDESIDQTIQHCVETGCGFVELGNGFLEPRLQGGGVGGQVPATITPEYQKSREEIRQWRLNTPMSFFEDVRKRFDEGGVNLFSMSYTIGDDFTDAEIDAAFKQMQALGLKLFQTNQTRVAMGPRMAPYAQKYKITPGWHTHQQSNDPNEVSSPESLAKLLAMSPQFMICLDIGHFADGGNDPFPWFQQHHDRISHMHIKDVMSIGGGAAVELGDGVLHIPEMLKAVRDNHYPIAFILERTYTTPGLTGIQETKKQMDWMRVVLES